MKTHIYVFILLILGGLFSPVYADTIWEVAPGRSTINFKVKHLVFLEVEGKFKRFEGKVVAPDEGFENSIWEARIQTQSIHTGNHDRDRDLMGDHFFKTSEYPEITFKSRSVMKAEDEEECYKIIGDLTIRGVKRTIELMAKCIREKKLANGKKRVDFMATGTLNRFDFGLRWNELLETGHAIVGDEVEITVNLALLK